MKRSKRGQFDGFGSDLLQGIRDKIKSHEDDAVFNTEVIGIEKATLAMIEAKVKDDIIVQLLQKHWDLRLSEAEYFLQKVRDDS